LYVQKSMPQGSHEDGCEKPPLTEWAFWGNCREQHLGQGRVRSANGDTYLYSSVVFADRNTPTVETGTNIEVREPDGYVRLAGDVKRFSKDEMHARIWV
jgi:hypothetical protein